MKSLRLILALAVVGFVATAIQAAETKEAPAAKQAGCCAKSESNGKACDHECCVAAAKAGNNCEKCHGSGKIEAKHEHKK